MTAEIGNVALLIGLVVALYGAAAVILGHRRHSRVLLESGYNAVLAHCALVTLALLTLEYALVTSDFSIRYVALNSSRNYALWYKIAGLWGALEGSLLLWAWMQAVLAAQVVIMYRRKHRDFMPYVSAVLMGISAFFLSVMLIPANPFERHFPVPADGHGLNPLLEDTSMLVHPLFLYSGYVGFTIPYAFAMAALITGRLTEEWLYITRRWAVLAWMFLTIGIIYGGWWAYYVLGWGGYWAWDPVENASIMPWLAGTAFIHSVMTQEKRGMLKVWNLTLISLTFALVIFGTFLTRSGILNSVHAFADGPVGYFFLTFLAVILLSTVTLLTYRADQLKTEGSVDSFLSREGAFLFNNLLLVTLCFTVFLGTIFPLLAEAVRGVKVSVGAPYFDYVAAPLGLGLLFLMGVGPVIPWRGASWSSVRRNLQGPGIAGLAGGLGAFVLGVGAERIATADAYAAFDALGRAEPATLHHNDLERAACSLVPSLEERLEAMRAAAGHAFVSGSGPTVVSASTSSKRWEMNRIAVPLARNAFTTSKSRWTSRAVSAAVGSSMTSTLASSEIAFAISTSCWSAIDNPLAGRSGSSGTPSRSNNSAA